MGKPSAPTPPDPAQTAAAQTSTNIDTAIANAHLGNVNQVTPDGSLTYTADHSNSVNGVPQYTATQTLSPEQQAIKDQSDAAELNMAGLANEQSGFLKNYLNKPIQLDNEATEERLFDLGSKRLNPQFDRRRDALETRLANQGIGLGTEAYDRAFEGLGQQENDAMNQLLLQGRGQSVSEQLTERNQPLNEITALLSGSQVSQPNFVPTSQPQMPTVDHAGLINQGYQADLNSYNQQMGSRNKLIGGLMGAGANLVALSDRRSKKDIKKRGSIDGMGLYEYRYKDQSADEPKHVGLMAQEVKKKKPEAIVDRPDGLMAVDYAKAI